MKYTGVTKAILPWEDHTGEAKFCVYTFGGTVDKRRILREVRKKINSGLKRKIKMSILKQILTIVPAPTIAMYKDDIKNEMNNWLNRIQDETESISDTGEETTHTTNTELPVSDVSDGLTNTEAS